MNLIGLKIEPTGLKFAVTTVKIAVTTAKIVVTTVKFAPILAKNGVKTGKIEVIRPLL